MPYLTHCHECDKPTANYFGICDNCIETTTADKWNFPIDFDDRTRQEKIKKHSENLRSDKKRKV
jgi:hypothetical protein